MARDRKTTRGFSTPVKTLLCCLGLMLLCLSNCRATINPEDPVQDEITEDNNGVAQAALIESPFYGPLRKKYQIADALISQLNFRPPVSPWIASEKAFYKTLLQGRTYDVLVVPFQTMGNGADPVGRMLMSYRLAISIERNTDLKVAPLPLVQPALGRLARFYDESEVLELARSLGVKRIIWGYAGTRDGSGPQDIHFSFAMVDQKGIGRSDGSGTIFKAWPYEALSPEILPSQYFADKIEDVLSFLKIGYHERTLSVPPSARSRLPVPESLRDVVEGHHFSRIHQSYILQMLAMLAPTDYHKNDLFAQSLINVFPIAKDDPDRRLIEARAYIHLYRRPAAIQVLRDQDTGEAKALMEYLNANLPESLEKVSKLKGSIKKLLAELELFDLRHAYKQHISDKEKNAFIHQYPGWRYFLHIYLSHTNTWKRSSNVELKLMLDKLFPVKGFSMQDLAVGSNIVQTGRADSLRFELLFKKHLRLTAAKLNGQHTDLNNSAGLGNDDLLALFDSAGTFNLIQLIRFYAFTQGLPVEALRVCDEIFRTYEGHPYFTLYKGLVLSDSWYKRSAEEKYSVSAQLYDLIFKAVWWNGCQNLVHRRARKYIRQLTWGKAVFVAPRELMHVIDSDYPFRTSIASYKRRPEAMLLSWTHTEISHHRNVYQLLSAMSLPNSQNRQKALSVLADIKARFNGNPEKVQLLATAGLPGVRHGRPQNPATVKDTRERLKKIYLKAVAAHSQNWDAYRKLAQLYIADEAYSSAKEVMLKYPMFKNPESYNSVVVSNRAEQAGEILYQKGQGELARPFFQLSINLNTGSGGSMLSKEYLALLDNDIQTAMLCALRRAKRYNSSGAYTNYMKYLHVTGNHDMAWSMFKNLLGRFNDRVIWYSASMGHRIQGTSQKELINWMKQMATLSPEEKQSGYIAGFGLWLLQDFAPNPELVRTIESVDDTPSVFIPNLVKLKILPASANVQKKNPGAPPPFHSSIARGYDLIRQKKYEAAFMALAPMMDHYGWTFNNAGSTLKSYLVWAAVKSGHVTEMDKTVMHYYKHVHLSKGYNFDEELAFAAYEGGTGHHAQAVQHLKNAFIADQNREWRIFSVWNQLLELCEWLYRDSGYEPYRDLALKWARSYQRANPMKAWAYAVEANLTKNRQDKIRALALAKLLGAKSKRLKPVSDQLDKAAARWLEHNNPFVLNSKPSTAGGV